MVDPAQNDLPTRGPMDSTESDSRYRVRVRRGTRIKLEPHSDSPDPNDERGRPEVAGKPTTAMGGGFVLRRGRIEPWT